MQEHFEKIKALLDERGIQYKASHHEPTYTSADAARIRGVKLEEGAKALILRGKKTGTNWLFVMPAHLRVDTKKVREIVGERVSFCPNPEEVSGCEPGSVPPFGSVLGLKTYVDEKLKGVEEINFNAGLLTDSINMLMEDYLEAEQPELVDIT